MTEKRFALSRLIPFLCLLLLPLGAIALGVMLLTVNTLFNTAFTVTFIVLPACFVFLSALIWFSKKGKMWLRVLFSVLLSVSFLLSVLFSLAVGMHEELNCYEGDDMIAPYAEMQRQNDFMPPLTEVGTPESMAYYDYYSQQMAFFRCEVDILICEYSEETYQSEKTRIETVYTFQADPLKACGYTCDATAQLDGYTFHVIAYEEGGSWDEYYPKSMELIATNDETREIVYLSFYDDDLDYIQDLSEFIRNDCGWKHIR